MEEKRKEEESGQRRGEEVGQLFLISALAG